MRGRDIRIGQTGDRVGQDPKAPHKSITETAQEVEPPDKTRKTPASSCL